MKRLSILIGMILLLAAFVSPGMTVAMEDSSDAFVPSDTENILTGVPYVWQEINGLCAWAATSASFQSAGVNLDLHEVLAASSVGFSFAYVNHNDTMLMYPGPVYMQVEPTQFAVDLYGLNMTVYFDKDTPGADQLVDIWQGRGIDVHTLDGQNEAFDLMRSSIDEGYPLLLSVNPAWLPAEDYDFLRAAGLSGGGHAILVVGYDDNSGNATIIDPGVGSFGDNFGYPADGRGNYTPISYTALNSAWSDRYYISILIKPGGPPAEDLSGQLGPYIRDRLLGANSAYWADPETTIIWRFGESAFRALGVDYTREGLTEFLDIFTGVEDERNFQASLLLFLGLGLESQVSLQFISFRAALQRLPDLMPDIDLTRFMSAGETALPHFEALADNATLIHLGNLTAATGFVAGTFRAMADSYNSTGDMASVITEYEDELATISGHLLGIADSWLAAGNALAEIWPNDPLIVYGHFIAMAAFGVGALVVAVVIWIRRTPSQ
ncbi:MAG: hypothetical protein ACE5H4_09070 [Candidatus Thorarchaeota archaeon]